MKIMIVDDEPHAIRRLTRFVEACGADFQVCATAINGQQALQLLAETPCDLLLTDIKMPVMDGMMLLDRVNERYPEMMKVAVSGYDDFSYVASAMRSQTLDYLLKPVGEENVRKLLTQLRERFDRRQYQKTRDRLTSLINRAEPGADKAEDGCFSAAVYCAGSLPVCTAYELCPGPQYWDRYPIKMGLRALNEDGTWSCWDFMGDTPAERIVIVQHDGREGAELFEGLYSLLREDASCPLNGLYSRRICTAQELPELLRRLRRALYESIRIGESALRVLEDTPAPARDTEPAMRKMEQIYTEKNGAMLAELFDQFAAEGWTQREIYGLLKHPQRKSFLESGGIFLDALSLTDTLADSVSAATSLQELESDVRSLLCAEAQPPKSVAGRIAVYLSHHMAEPLTNQSLAKVFGYVPGYLSVLFRREYGCSPSEYLLDLRLSRAREMLESDPNLLVRDAAFAVGFKSQYHFSKSFKKKYDLWPSECR